MARRALGALGATAVVLGVSIPLSMGQAGAAPSITFGQCRDGGIATIPGVACDNAATTYQNGDLNALNSHYQEGDFVPFRLILGGLTAGDHTLDFGYQITDGGPHAYDYLGSFDATETTSATPSALYANNNNPCDGGIMPDAWCDPSTPTAQTPVIEPDFSTAVAGSPTCGNGTFDASSAPFVQGDISLFGPPTSTMSDFGYDTPQVSSQGSGCITNIHVSFSLPADLAPGQSIVIAWSGHIASQADWGVGNGAGDIHGAPWHMFLNSLDGATIGQRDRSIHESTIFFAPSITTQIHDSTGAVVTSVPGGTTVYDQAIVTNASPTMAGTLTYTLYGHGDCTGPVLGSWPVTVAGSSVPPSGTYTVPFADETISFRAAYPGDQSRNVAAAGPCEPLTVNKPQPTVATTVMDSHNLSIVNPVALGTVVYDTSTLTGGATPGGTLTYTFFSGSDTCTKGHGVTTSDQTVNVTNGTVQPSADTASLTAGAYSYLATYNGDADNAASVASCEPVDVNQGATSLVTTVTNQASGAAWGTSPGPLGSGASDTVVLSGALPGIPLTGQVNYYLFTDAPGTSGCTGTSQLFDTVTVGTNGTVPNSKGTGPLAGGNYGFEAQYTGDSDYAASPMGDCEPFSVGTVALTLATSVNQTGSSASDSATLLNQVATIPATGTVTYTLFSGTCQTGTEVGSPSEVFVDTKGAVPDSATFGPLSAGDYYFLVTYTPNGTSYTAGPPDCEPFQVPAVTPTTAGSTTTGSTVTPAGSGSSAAGSSSTHTATESGAAAKPSGLAFTGAYIAVLALLGAALVLVGGGFAVIARRRRRSGRPA